MQTLCGILYTLIRAHREAGVVHQQEADWGGEQLLILYERQMVLGHPCKLLVLSHPYKLLVPLDLGHSWKWLRCIYHGNPWKWLQDILSGVDFATVRLAWVVMVMWWDGLS